MARILPYYSDSSFDEVKNAWMTLDCIRAEMRGMQASIQNLTYLVVNQTQQLAHPMGCRHFSLHAAPSNVDVFQGLDVLEPNAYLSPAQTNPDLLSAKPKPKKKTKRLKKSSQRTASLPNKPRDANSVTKEMIDEALQQLKRPEEKATLITEEDTPLNKQIVNEVLADCGFSPVSPIANQIGRAHV